MKKHPFRFGVTSYGANSGAEWAAKVRQAEALEYSTWMMPDHFSGQLSPVPALASAAALTSRLRLGSVVFANDFRHPIVVAKEAATLDFLSNGRFELGIGAGWFKGEFDALGLAFDAPSIRVARLRESLAIIKQYFDSTLHEFAGQFYHIDNAAGLDYLPSTVQRPHPPILIGAGGKQMLSFAAQQADIISLAARMQPDGTGPDVADLMQPLSKKIEWIERAAPERMEHLELNVQTWAFVLTDNRQQALAQLTQQFPLPEGVLGSLPYLLVGTAEQICEQIMADRERYGISYYLIWDRDMDAFAPIAHHLTGK